MPTCQTGVHSPVTRPGLMLRKKREKKHKVPLLKLSSFADFYDYVLMAIGSIGTCVHGASVPVFFIFFGKLINVIGVAYLFPKEASHQVAKYSLDFVYLSIAILFSSWTGGLLDAYWGTSSSEDENGLFKGNVESRYKPV